MKLAYIILAYKDVEQVSHLINRLRTEGSSFVVHVCKNTSNYYISQLKKLQEGYNDVFFCKREEGVHFYFGLVKGTLNALQTLSDLKIDYNYVSLISGQDYPLRTNEEIKYFLEKNKGKEFLTCWPLFPDNVSTNTEEHPWGKDRQIYRVDRFHIKFTGKVNSIPEIESRRLIEHNFFNTVKIFFRQAPAYFKKNELKREFLLLFYSRLLPKKRELPKNFELYGGSTWWTITKNLAEHILLTNKKNRGFNNFFRYALIPDEMYFQTHAMNSPFREHVVNNNLREIIWNPEDKTHPILFTGKDFDFLTKSSALFARKFDVKLSAEIVNQLDTHLESTKQII